MSIEIIILVLAWILSIIMLILYVPKNKIREAQVIFLFKQVMTWLLGLTVAQFKLIEYPVRAFEYATRTSFSFEYFIYPSICVVFNLHYPEGKGSLKQSIYYFNYCSIITIIEVLCEKYTNIIKYTNWTWYITWISFFLTFYASRRYYIWFFSRLKPFQRDEK